MEPQDTPFVPTRRARKRIVSGTLPFCALLIAWIVGWGDPASGLHSTALISAFTLVGVIVNVYVVGSVVDNYNVVKRGPASE